MQGWQFWLMIIVLSLLVQGFFAMVEMASVSFNKVRLQYYVSKGKLRAIWLHDLLQHPGKLFGTSLICINTALQIGSEASRRLYESLHLNPDFSPLSQVLLVLIFAEIAPLFAGRRYAEHAAMMGVPVLYGVSFVLRPVIWFLDLCCQLAHHVIGGSGKKGSYLSREEIQKVFEEREGEELNTVAGQIFSLRSKVAQELMQPMKSVQLISSTCTITEMRALLQTRFSPFVPIFHKTMQNIVAIAYPRDLLRSSEHTLVLEYARPPWFITEKDSIMNILLQFRRNNHSIAVVLNERGWATGILTLDEIVDEIFGLSDNWMSYEEMLPRSYHVMVDRTFPGNTEIAIFNKTYKVHLDNQGCTTLEELVSHLLGHSPSSGESVRIDQFELTVEEVTLLGSIKSVSVRTLY